MARAGLGDEWECLFANDVAEQKIAAYTAQWGDVELDRRDIVELRPKDLPATADLAWASFPCQDLSIAGNGLGIGEAGGTVTRSGALWPFLSLMAKLAVEGRPPRTIVLENVTGLLTSNAGKDFRAICRELQSLGYVFGAAVVDAKYFLPQSRPRIFIVAVRSDLEIPTELVRAEPQSPWHTSGILRAYDGLEANLRSSWRWWELGIAPVLPDGALLTAVDIGPDADWHPSAETERLLSMMPASHLARLAEAKNAGSVKIGSLYLRMRPERGGNVQRAEVSFGVTLGCLRTPRGGGSRPRIIVVDGENVRTRLLSAREAAGLMGLPPEYPLPERYQHAFQLIGDGVAAPVVRFLAAKLVEPLARSGMERAESEADTLPSMVAAEAM